MFDRALAFARENIILTCVQHAVGGFGLAIVLQVYLQGNSFAPLWLGWLGVAFSVAIHVYEIGLVLMSATTSNRTTTATRTYSSSMP